MIEKGLCVKWVASFVLILFIIVIFLFSKNRKVLTLSPVEAIEEGEENEFQLRRVGYEGAQGNESLGP
jgi:hypothetical protein